MPRVVHFEIQADDAPRAIRFYSDAFGWDFRRWQGDEPYWYVRTGDDASKGINGGLVPRREPLEPGAPSAFVCTIGVPSIDDYVERVTSAGGSVDRPRFAIAGVGWMAWLRDTEGNRLGLIEHDAGAR